MLLPATLLFAAFGSSASAQIGALQTNCGLGGSEGRSYQFVATCAGRATSPDGNFSIVQRAYQERQPAIELQDRRRRIIAKISALSDDMPFRILWAPNSRWFVVDHHVGSFMDRPEGYEIVNGRVVSHDQFRRVGQREAQRLFPCLPRSSRDWANGSTAGWSKDSRRIAWVFITRTDMCSKQFGGKSVTDGKSWRPIWMISDVASGRIIPGSERIDNSEGGLHLPRDHRYDEFR